MKTLVTALALLILSAPAYAKPYKTTEDSWACGELTAESACIRQGMRDYREGLCFRARPYTDGSPEDRFWRQGYNSPKNRKRDWSHCYGTRGHD